MNNISEMNIEDIVKYVNEELRNGRTMKDIETTDFGVNERVITKRLNRRNYKKIDNQFILNNTSSTTNKNISNIAALNDIDLNKLSLLLNNIDTLLDIINKKNTTSSITLSSKETKVTSLRINTELYDLIRRKAKEENISISDIVNRALIDYLKNYV